ncbi:MAG: hypothetical protein RQ745_08490 [Longimicrobiales bacterium]|nr:hypothetical protein [Longimicrobiales bacterium]
MASPKIVTAGLVGLALLTACAPSDTNDTSAARVALIEDFTPGDTPAACEAVTPGFEIPSDIEDLRTLGDSALLVHFGAARVVVEADATLAPSHLYEYAREGVGAVKEPRGVIGFPDSVIVADAAGASLVTLRRDGTSATRRLDFSPDRIVETPVGLVVTEMSTPFSSTLARRVTGEEVAALPIPKEILDGATMATIGNTTTPIVVDGGQRVLLFHQFIAPLVHTGSLNEGAFEWETRPLPIPAAHEAKAWWYPEAPYHEADIESIIAPTIAAAGRPDGSEIFVLGRSGRRRAHHAEKAIFAFDRNLSFTHGWTLDFNASHMAYLPRESVLILATPMGEWYRCSVD